MPVGNVNAYDPGGTIRLDAQVTNTAGGLFTAVLFEGTNRDIADYYTLTVSAASGSTCTITVTCAAGAANPYHNKTFASTVFDGSTNRTMVPGITLTKKNGAVANGNSSIVRVGLPAGIRLAGNPTGTQLLATSAGIFQPGETAVAAGQPGLLYKSVIKNDGSEATSSTAATRHPVGKLVNKTLPWAFEYIEILDDQPTERVVSGVIQPNMFTFANFLAGSPNKIDVKVNEGAGAATFNVVAIGGSPTPVASTQLLCDGSTRYQIVSAGLKSLGEIFVLATTAANTSEEGNPIWNRDTSWIAPDVAGSAGTWSLSSVTETQSGQSSGVLLPAGTSLLWGKLDISALDLPDFFQGDVSIEYAKTGMPAWFV